MIHGDRNREDSKVKTVENLTVSLRGASVDDLALEKAYLQVIKCPKLRAVVEDRVGDGRTKDWAKISSSTKEIYPSACGRKVRQ